LQPMNIEIRQRKIDLLEEYGNKEEAINEYINLADAFFPLAELDSARSAYTKALVLAKSITDDGGFRLKLLLRLADIDIQRLDWDSAIATFKEITEYIPSHKKASVSIVDLNYRLGKKPAAELEIDRFLSLYDPQTDGDTIRDYLVALKEEISGEDYIIRCLVKFYSELGQREQVITELDGLGDMLLDAGRKQDAVAVIEEIITMNPPNLEAYQKLLIQLRA